MKQPLRHRAAGTLQALSRPQGIPPNAKLAGIPSFRLYPLDLCIHVFNRSSDN